MNDNKHNARQLFEGDMRLDALSDAIEKEINDRATGQGIPICAILGLLDVIKDRLIREINDR